MPASTTKAEDPAPTATSEPPVQRAAASPRESSRSRSPPPTPLWSTSGLPADLARLVETTMDDGGADVEFEVGGKVFAAHKLVLASRSPVFRAEFFGAAKEEATTYLRVCDMHADTFGALLHYVYTDSLPPAAVLAPVPVTGRGGARREEEAAAVVLAQDLVVAADRYGLRGLKSLAESELCRRSDVVGVATVLPMLALAERHQCWELMNKCLEFIASLSAANARAVMATDDVEHLARNCPAVVKELVVKLLEAKKTTPRPRSPQMGRGDAFYLALGFIWAFVFPLVMWALMDWGYLGQK